MPALPLQAVASRAATLKPTGFRPDAADTSTRSAGESVDKAGPLREAEHAAPGLPATVTVNSFRPQPDQVKAALDQQFREAGELLETRNILALYPALIAFDRLDVQKVQLKGDQGWAQVAIRGAVVIAGADKRPRKKAEVQRWLLHRVGDDTWELALPADATYIPREPAVHILAQQLAALTDDSADSNLQTNQKVQLARWLNVLLDVR